MNWPQMSVELLTRNFAVSLCIVQGNFSIPREKACKDFSTYVLKNIHVSAALNKPRQSALDRELESPGSEPGFANLLNDFSTFTSLL